MNENHYTQIDFGNHCRAILEIIDGKIAVVDAMNGWGDTIPNTEITVVTFGRSPQSDAELNKEVQQ